MNLPNKLTIIRLLLIPVFVALFFVEFTGHVFVALGVFVLACLTDFLDGYIARKYNLVTDLGKFLDPIADKVLVMAALVLLCITGRELTMLYAIGTIIILAREFIVTGFRTIAAGKNIVLAADNLGKIKTNFQMFAIIFLLPVNTLYALGDKAVIIALTVMVVGLVCFIMSLVFTILSATNYITKNVAVLKEDKAEIKSESVENDVIAEGLETAEEKQE